MTEQEMRDAKVPWPKTIEELTDYINILSKENDDYGKAVYIMSKAATATFYYMSHVVGATGFQASMADLDILRRTRSIESPFAIITGEDMLYPQYDIIGKVKEYLTEWETWASKKAKKNMEENEQGNVHPNVWKRWEELAAKEVNQ
jgi:thymidylate synthase